jgi:hypothetical protein
MIEIVQIRAANPPGLDYDLDLTLPWGFGRAVLNANIPSGINDDGFHNDLIRQPA